MRDAAGAGALALVAIFALIQSLRLDVGAVTRPGPGLFPLLLSVALLVTAIWLQIAAVRRRARAPEPGGDDAPRSIRSLLAALGAFAVYVVVFEPLGFVISTLAWLIFLFAVVARYSWPVSIGAGLVITVVARVVFDTWLQVRLPPGLLGR
jgi:hypothetical protein